MERKVWLITGISSGLGKALAQEVMKQGDILVGTFRDQARAQEFNDQYKERGLALTLDVTQPVQIEQMRMFVEEKFGRTDVLVNNAGFGLAGAIEETDMNEVRDVFETNFFGTLQMTRAFLPVFRRQRSGHIIQLSSHTGFRAVAGFGIYSAAKFAVEGFSEALAQELESLNIKLTIVEPGPFRTDFAGRGFRFAKQTIGDYNTTVGAFRKRMKEGHGKQEGDPDKAAAAIFNLSRTDHPPLRLPLGKIAVQSLTAKLKSVNEDVHAYRHIAETAVFDADAKAD